MKTTVLIEGILGFASIAPAAGEPQAEPVKPGAATQPSPPRHR